MAGEEDVELRDLVAQTLETKGVLGKIRAQLRASVFLALEEQESDKTFHPLANSKIQQFLTTKDGQEATALVREFLEFFGLDYSCAVFDPESTVLETYPGRDKLASALGLDSSDSSTSPLLFDILKRSKQQTPSQPFLSSIKELRIPETGSTGQEDFPTHGSDRTPPLINSMHPLDVPSDKSGWDDSQFSHHSEKFGHLRGSDTAFQNSHTIQTVVGATVLNTNDISNLGGSSQANSSFLSKHTQPTFQNGTETCKKELDIGVGSLHTQGAQLGETFTGNSTLDIDKQLNSAENLDKLADLARDATAVKTGDSDQDDELNNFFDKAQTKGSDKPSPIPVSLLNGDQDHIHRHIDVGDHISDDLSVSLSSSAATVTGKFETEDMTLSEHSLPGDLDYFEQVQS